MLRSCDEYDVPFLMQLAIRFNKRFYDIPLNYSKTWDFIAASVGNPKAVVLRTHSGAILGVVADDPCRDWLTLLEVAWYSEGLDGMRLLKAFEERGWELGVNEIRMTTLAVNPTIGKILMRREYTEIETSHRLLL